MILSKNGKTFIPFFKMENKVSEHQKSLPLIDKKQHLKELFQRHHRQIFKLCLQVTKDYEVAENLTIKVFVQFYNELDGLDSNIKFKDYLHKLTISHLIDYKWQTAPPLVQK